MAVTTNLKRACLDDAWDAAKAGNQSLRDVLRSFETAARKLVVNGSIASLTVNGRVTTFSLQGPGSVTTAEITDLWRDLINRFDEVSALDPNAEDAGIYTAMMANLRAIKGYTANFMYLAK